MGESALGSDIQAILNKRKQPAQDVSVSSSPVLGSDIQSILAKRRQQPAQVSQTVPQEEEVDLVNRKAVNNELDRVGNFFGSAAKKLVGFKSKEEQESEQKELAGRSVAEVAARGAASGIGKGLMVLGGPASIGVKTALQSAGVIGGITGVKSYLEGLSKGEADRQEAASEGLVGSGIDLAVTAATSTIPRILAHPIKKGAKLGRKFIKSKRIIERLEAQIGKLDDKFKRDVVDLDDKINKLDEVSFGKVEPSKESIEVLSEKKPLIEQLSNLDKSVDEHLKRISKPVNQGVNKLKGHFRKKYKEVLGKESGNTPINLSDEIDDIADALGIQSTKEKSTLEKISNSFDVDDVDGIASAGIKGKKGFLFSTDDPTNIALREAHWLKQATDDFGRKLLNGQDASAKALGARASQISQRINDKLGTASSEYKGLSGAYKDFKQMSDLADSALGKVKAVPGQEATRFSSRRIANSIRDASKEGRALGDELVGELFKPVAALNAKASVLRDNGFVKDADQILESMNKISNAYDTKFKVTGALSELKTKAKDASGFQEFQKEINKIKSLKTKYKMEKRALQVKNKKRNIELEKRGESPLSFYDDVSSIQLAKEVNLKNATYAFARTTPSSISRVFAIPSLLNEARVLGIYSAAKIEPLMKKFVNLMEGANKNTKGAINSLIQTLAKEEDTNE